MVGVAGVGAEVVAAHSRIFGRVSFWPFPFQVPLLEGALDPYVDGEGLQLVEREEHDAVGHLVADALQGQ